MMKNLVFILALACSLVTAGCSASTDPSPGGENFSADDAIAKTVKEQNWNDFPPKTGRIKGIIKGGGPQPGIRVQGEFESKAVKHTDSGYLVTLTEYWEAKDFKGEGTSSEKDTLSYYWKYLVTPEAVRLLDQGGDFPPDHVE